MACDELDQQAFTPAAAVAQAALHTTLCVYTTMYLRTLPADRASLKQVG
jgi:hypothetical protein